jgi:hypothetical protein
VNAAVTDDASLWIISQTLDSGRSKGIDIINNVPTPFDRPIPPCPETGDVPPCPDGPVRVNLQQVLGQRNIFYIDAPGPYSFFAPLNLTRDSVTSVQNFTVHLKRLGETRDAFTLQWYVKIVVNAGGSLDMTNSTAGLGHISTDF